MTDTLLSPVETNTIQILIVDDEAAARQDIINSFGENNCIDFVTCKEPEEVGLLEDKDFKICILDIRYDGENRSADLLATVKTKWPATQIVILSNFPADLGADEKRNVRLIYKSKFNVDPSVLQNAVVDIVSYNEEIEQPLADELIKSLRAEGSLALAQQEVELFYMTGYVEDIQEPYVQIVIDETEKDEFLPKLLSFSLYSLFRPSEPKAPKRLRLRYAAFKAAGIAQDMRFSYRIYRKANQTICEINPGQPLDEGELKPRPLAPELKRLLIIEDNLRKAALSNQHQNKSSS